MAGFFLFVQYAHIYMRTMCVRTFVQYTYTYSYNVRIHVHIH